MSLQLYTRRDVDCAYTYAFASSIVSVNSANLK